MFAYKSEPFLLTVSAVTAISMMFVSLSLYALIPFVLLLVSTIFLMYFFRDPPRVSPKEEGILVSPADGKVKDIIRLEDGTIRIHVELSVFNVHVNRAPIDCRVTNITKVKGGHWPVWFKDHYSKENARQHFDLETNEGFSFRVTQIAGIFAWRCVSYVKVGSKAEMNDKIGIIRFGSAANVDLPGDCGYNPVVEVGQKLRAGETIIARRK